MISNGPRSRVRLFMTSDRDPVSEQSLVLNWDYGTASANLNHSVGTAHLRGMPPTGIF